MKRKGNPEGEVTVWNRRVPVGTKVDVTLDNGNIWTTKTRSEAWVLSGHTAVVMLEGKSGGYLLSRVKPALPSTGAGAAHRHAGEDADREMLGDDAAFFDGEIGNK